MSSFCANGTGFIDLVTAGRRSRRDSGDYRIVADLIDCPYADYTCPSRLEGPRSAFSAAMHLAALAAILSYLGRTLRDLPHTRCGLSQPGTLRTLIFGWPSASFSRPSPSALPASPCQAF